MIFCSPIFLFLFLPLVFVFNALSPKRLKNAILLLASIAFYIWGERLFFLVMLASIVVNWLLGLTLDACAEAKTRKAIVALSVAVNIGLLCFYKYTGFIASNLNGLLASFGLQPIDIATPHLPLGISFFTFHALSYVIDVYRHDAKAQKNPIDFALYISFFPQLIAGPIIRYHDIYRQLTERKFDWDLAASGVERFITGLGKKMLLANTLGEVADRIFEIPSNQINTPAAWLGIVCYTLQIYLDFSAYSDMAIGLARMFGFKFLENFNYPYIAQSMQDFWRRWHISLSNWMRDYLYIPLGGNRVSKGRVYANLLIVFAVCGLWHGANWTFVVWGLIHGLFLALERAGLAKIVAKMPRLFQHVYVLLIVALAWVFFRSTDISHALNYIAVMFGTGSAEPTATPMQFIDPSVSLSMAFGLLTSTPLFSCSVSDWKSRKGQARGELSPAIDTLQIGADGNIVLAVRLVLMIVILLLAAGRIAAGTYNPFIYFRF